MGARSAAGARRRAFTSELTITQLSGNDRHGWRLWRLAEPLIYEVGDRGSARVILVSKGFITDGPSIPQFLWAILPVWASWSRAGVIHDYLCCLIALNNPHPEAPTRDHADRIFLEAMKVLNVGWVQKTLLYLGVRIGTWLNVRTTMVDHNIKLAEIVGSCELGDTDRAAGHDLARRQRRVRTRKRAAGARNGFAALRDLAAKSTST